MSDKLCPGCPGDPNETCCKPELRVQAWRQQQANQQPVAARVSVAPAPLSSAEILKLAAGSAFESEAFAQRVAQARDAQWRVTIALRPQAVPMTDEQILKAMSDAGWPKHLVNHVSGAREFTAALARRRDEARGITAQGAQGGEGGEG